MQSVLGEVADVIRSSKSAGGVSKKLKTWAKHPAAYDQIGDAIFEPAVRSDLAGQMMVYGREAKIIKLAAADGGGEPVPWIEKPWDEALAEWRARGLMSEQEFSRLLRDYAQRSDVARRLMLDQVQTIVRQHLDDAIAQGKSLSEFASDVERGVGPLGITPNDPSYLNLVFRTNVQAAYGAGRYRAMEDPDVQAACPYVQYRTVGDARVRPAHALLDGLVWPVSTAAWRQVAPPNGFNCRCSEVSLTAEEARDYTIVEHIPEGAEPDEGFGGPPVARIKQ